LDRLRIETILRRALRRLRPDVINVHNIHLGSNQGWGPELVRICAEVAPVAWTLHDMWSFTGRCAYSYDCRKFETGCDASCPTAGEYPSLEPNRIAPAWETRRQMLRELAGLTAVTPSRWLAAEARRGLWAGHAVHAIPNSLPVEVFRPLERRQARARLGLDESGSVVLVVAHQLTDVRKGGHILPHVWGHVGPRPLTLLTMGAGEVAIRDASIRVVPLGWIADYEKQAEVYSAADVLLHPAPVDNLPCVVMEALACGTPVVGFPIGGVPEMVLPDVSGWLAAEVSAVSLGQTLGQALESIRAGQDLRASCRALAEREYAPQVQAARYLEVFAELQRRRQAA
jgi:glycosyltransferase involved in cell wall biosynthesis